MFIIKSSILILFIILLSGCSKQSLYPANYPGLNSQDSQEQALQTPTQAPQDTEIDDKQAALLEKLHAEYKKWEKTPYRYGSTGQSGTDCSGFVQAMYKEAFAIDLPRDSSNQVLKGTEVSASQLQPGDLVFFKINPHLRHVGIYVGNNSFIHSATRGGVMISNMGMNYWKTRYWTSRRMLTEGTYTAQN